MSAFINYCLAYAGCVLALAYLLAFHTLPHLVG